jgi:predicted nucleic acid-binding protein
MERYLIDTNVFSDFMNNSFSQNGMDFLSNLIDNGPEISVITRLELLCWKTNFESEFWIKEFISSSNVIPISEAVIQNCVRIRRTKRMKLPDAIIAATALTFDYTIITNNTKDFENIERLKFLNPYQL